MRGRKTLEINPEHPIITSLNTMQATQTDAATSMVKLLYETALITSGFGVDSPREFAGRIYEMIGAAANVGGGAGAAASSSASSSAKSSVKEAEVVTAEVVEDESDPWKKK